MTLRHLKSTLSRLHLTGENLNTRTREEEPFLRARGMVYERYREIAKEMIMAGVKAADPTQAVMDSVKLSGKTLTVRGDTFNLEDYDKILMFGIGKAAAPMAGALEQVVECDGGLVITKKGDEIGEAEVNSVRCTKLTIRSPVLKT